MKEDIDEDLEKVDYWSYGCIDNKIRIYFDKRTRYIEITPKDLKSMVEWIAMRNKTYYPGWHRGLL